ARASHFKNWRTANHRDYYRGRSQGNALESWRASSRADQVDGSNDSARMKTARSSQCRAEQFVRLPFHFLVLALALLVCRPAAAQEISVAAAADLKFALDD